MPKVAQNPIKFTDTTFRDAHQSLLATRMRTEDMLPIAEKMDQVGFYSMEVWGGATFDAPLRFLKENPWDRLRQLRAAIKKTKLQMLLRGQNVVGYRHYPDDTVKKFVELAAKNGIDIFRIFDALNDPRNMQTAIKAVHKAGAHAQMSFSYTISPVHNVESFVKQAKILEGMGADSICIKDMAGLLSPFIAKELVTRLKEEINVPIQLHSHYTSGMASMTYLEAIKAGVDVVDTAISSLAQSTSQPPCEAMVAVLEGTPWDSHLDLELLSEVASYIQEVRERYEAYECGLVGVDTNVLQFQVPGGMMSNLVNQLREQNALDRLQDVLDEVPRVRKELGYPPLVTPSSQIVGTQATLNVLLGKRYKTIPEEVKQYVRGFYGRPPAPIDSKTQKLVIGNEKPITCRPADLLEPAIPIARRELKGVTKNIEDIISYILFPQPALEFFRYRKKQEALGQLTPDILAAITAALLETKPEPATILKIHRRNGNESNPWVLAGRREAMGYD
ncbi:MAG: pyruvate/oxaloacetate carboxyltransferase [Candidatus Thorarchaeota archaeon]